MVVKRRPSFRLTRLTQSSNLSRMNARAWRFLLTLLLAIAPVCLHAGGSPQEDIPLDSWVYDAVFELSTQGHFTKLLLHTRPYTRGEVAAGIAELSDSGASLDPATRFLVERLRSEFAEELAPGDSAGTTPSADDVRLGAGPNARVDQFRHGYAKNRIGLDAIGSFATGDHIAARTRVRFDSDGRQDTQFHGEYWKEKFTAGVDQAVVTGQFGRFRLVFGREFWRWGRSPVDAMLISDNSPPFDGLRLSYRGRNWAFCFHTTMLDPMGTDPSDPDEPFGIANRYLVGHRFDWRPLHNLEVAVSEVMVYGGVNRPWALNYLNPILPYYWEQLNNDINDNPLWNLELSWRPRPGLEFYGEWVIDDFQIDFISEPQQIGLLGGLAWSPATLERRLFINTEYERINTFVYGQGRSWNLYVHDRDYTGQAIGIGSNLGTDADRITVRPRYHVSSTLDLTALAEYVRRGENRIDTPQAGLVPKGVEFPSGVVERRLTAGLGGHAQMGAHVVLDFSTGYEKIRNVANAAGSDRQGPFVRVRLWSLWWRTFGV